MILREPRAGRVESADLPDPRPSADEVLVRVAACGVCRTDLHVVDGDLPDPAVPVVPGHEIVGRIVETGGAVSGLAVGQRVGIPWLAGSCARCRHCAAGRENLCADARYTGYTRDGGYGELVAADHRFTFPLAEGLDDVHAAPLLCAGLIGFRAYRMAVDSVPWELRRLGLYGFGAAAHLLAQVAAHDGLDVYAFTRPGDVAGQRFARSLGAGWAGGSDARAPEPLDAAILFAPVGELVPIALRAVAPGGVVVCAGIHMSDIPALPYRLLWEERVVRSVANLTRRDGEDFLALAPKVPVRPRVTPYPLADANRALADLRAGRLEGAAVLVP